MTEITKDQKEKLNSLEGSIKIAFKEGNFEQVSELADEIKAIDPENRLVIRILEKAEKAKADLKKKENAEKIKEYEKMLCKQMKEGNIENIRKLTEELKELDITLSAKWNEKADKAEADIKKRENAEKIKDFENQLKLAFKEKRFEEVENLSKKLKEMDPENKISLKLLSKVEEAKADVIRKENAEKINELQDKIKLYFEEGRFEDMGKTANQLFEIDPKNSFANKYLSKAIKEKEKAESEAKEVKASAEPKEAMASAEEKKSEGFFAKIFKKSEKTEESATDTADISKAEIKTESPISSVIASTAPVVKNVDNSKIQQDEIKPAEDLSKTTEVSSDAEAEPLRLKTEVSAKESSDTELESSLESDNGNIFTKMFGKKEGPEDEKKSIIDTIVAKTSEKRVSEKEKMPKKEKEQGVALIGFSRTLLQFSLAFVLLTAGFFYVQNIDVNNTVLGFLGVEDNYASGLHKAGETLITKEEQEKVLNRDINKYKAGYDDKHETIIKSIIDKRLNWPDILVKINEIANAVYERNEISQYITFDNFSFDAERGQIRVSGSLSDPLGKNLTKLVELEETFRNFPKDPKNPADTTAPYFINVQEFSSLSKSYDRNTGKYRSSFSMSFSLNPNR